MIAALSLAVLVVGQASPVVDVEMRFAREPVPAVTLIRSNGRSLTDVYVVGLSVHNRTPAAVTVQSLVLSLLVDDELLESATLGPKALMPLAAKGSALFESKLWRELIFGRGWIPDGAQAATSLEIPGGQRLILSGIPVRHLGKAAASTVEARVCFAGSEQCVHRRVPLAFPTVKAPYSFPLRGAWQVINNWDDANQHRYSAFTHFAQDFGALARNGTVFERRPARRNSDVAGFGATVCAPAEGTVVDIKSDVVDNPPGKRPDVSAAQPANDRELLALLAGNYIILSHPEGEYSLLAHLKHNSIRVKLKQQVRRGQAIAQVGNGGNSALAHLHFQVFDGPDPFAAQTLQLRYSNLFDTEGYPVTFIEQSHALVHVR